MTEIKLEIKEEQRELYERLLGIVRCKDCRYWLPHTKCGVDENYNEYHNYCKYHMTDELYPEYWEADDFCSYGESEDDDKD